MEENNKTFTTDNVDVAAYLYKSGLRYLGCERFEDTRGRKAKAFLKFADPKEQARDLEQAYFTSEEKKFRDANKYLLKEVHRTCSEEGVKNVGQKN